MMLRTGDRFQNHPAARAHIVGITQPSPREGMVRLLTMCSASMTVYPSTVRAAPQSAPVCPNCRRWWQHFCDLAPEETA